MAEPVSSICIQRRRPTRRRRLSQFRFTKRKTLDGTGLRIECFDRSRRRRSRPISRVLSRTTIHLGCVSPRTSSDLPGSLHGPCVQPRVQDSTLRASLFGLAPGGVCHATECYHRRGALLPHHFTLTASVRRFGGLFSVALSVDSRPPGVTWRLALGARTFLHACAQRLPGRLRRAWWGCEHR